MKYREEWQQTQTKEKFVKLLLKKFPHITKKTAVRRFYDVRRLTTSISTTPPFFELDQKEEQPIGIIKMIMIKDMNRYKMKITVPMLKQHGFTKPEIQWLRRNKHIRLEG